VQKVNWGIIGLGKIALKFSEGFKNIDNAKLLGISSKDNKKLKKFKEDFKIENNFCFNNYENLLECKDIDIIYIALPNSLHHEWIIKCIEKEKKILVEKPATLNFSQMKDVQNKLLKLMVVLPQNFAGNRSTASQKYCLAPLIVMKDFLQLKYCQNAQ